MTARSKKKLICGMEGENVVAHGLLPSPTHPAKSSDLRSILFSEIFSFELIATSQFLNIKVSFYLNV